MIFDVLTSCSSTQVTNNSRAAAVAIPVLMYASSKGLALGCKDALTRTRLTGTLLCLLQLLLSLSPPDWACAFIDLRMLWLLLIQFSYRRLCYYLLCAGQTLTFWSSHMGISWPLPDCRASNRVSSWQGDGYGRVAKAALDAAERGSFGGGCRLRSPASGAWLSIGPGDCGILLPSESMHGTWPTRPFLPD